MKAHPFRLGDVSGMRTFDPPPRLPSSMLISLGLSMCVALVRQHWRGGGMGGTVLEHFDLSFPLPAREGEHSETVVPEATY